MKVYYYETLPSTNTLLKEMASDNAPEGTIVIAKSQTAGRGRTGKSFYSPSGTGLYMSILLKPGIPASDSVFITPMTAVAVAEAIEELSGKKTEVKWVNDIYLNGKKICGILTEGSFNKDIMEYAVVGIGINLAPPENGFPEDISGIAGEIFSKADDKLIKTLADKITQRLFFYYRTFSEKSFINEYIRRCTFLKGKKINIKDGNRTYTAIAGGADENCRLEITDSDGNTNYLSTGDVSISV